MAVNDVETRRMIEQALKIAEDLTDGRVTAAEVTAATITECRALVGSVVGPDDECWPLQQDICRGVLAQRGGIPSHELHEWYATALRWEAEAAGLPVAPWIDQMLAKLAADDDQGNEAE